MCIYLSVLIAISRRISSTFYFARDRTIWFDCAQSSLAMSEEEAQMRLIEPHSSTQTTQIA
jgi:hypothetical protein